MTGGLERWTRPAAMLLAWGLAAVFAYAGGVKVADPAGFAAAVGNYQLLPGWSVNLPAVCLPWIELGAALALCVPAWRRSGALLVLGMSGTFALAILSAWMRGLDISCGCFGTGSHGAGAGALAIDIACLAAALAVWRLSGQGTDAKAEG
jgi:putative oxidoreductase